MIDQQFFKELDEYLSSRPPRITLPPLELLNLKPIRRRYGYFGIIPGPSFGEVSLTPEEQHIRAFMEEFGKKKEKFKKTGTYLYDEFVWPALLKLDESGFETEGKRLFEEKNGTLCLKSSLFCRYADIDPKRISGLKSGSEPVTKETLLKLVIALKMDLKTAEEFMEAGGYPFDTVNDDQDAIIQFSIKYSARRGVPFSVKEYRHILKEGHLHAHYRGIYDKLRVKKRDNKAYAPAADSEAYELTPEYIEELATETKIIFKDGNMKPETKALKPSIEEINQKLINNYIIPFIKKSMLKGKISAVSRLTITESLI